jgi:putative aminopeptidase FrvX
MEKLYRDLVDLPGAPSFEKPIRNYMRENLTPYVDEIIEDKLGSIFGVINKGSTGPKVMIAGHMDEVGGIVTGIEKSGLISITNLGGMNGDVFLAQHFDILTDDLEKIPGVSASKPPHLTRGSNDAPKKIEYKDLKIDIGADDKEHAEKLGVKIGQQVIARNDFTVTKDGKKFISKAWDNRFGCGMALEIARDIKKGKLDVELYVGATVQEEVGLRGAQTAAGLINPDIFLAVDCSPCQDTFGGDDVSGSLGKGFMVRFVDPSAIMHQGMKKYILGLAEENDIKYQYYKSMGGTDAARIQLHGDGVLAATIGMPARYIHSSTSMIHKDDHAEVKKILVKILETLNWDTVKEIKSNV